MLALLWIPSKDNPTPPTIRKQQGVGGGRDGGGAALRTSSESRHISSHKGGAKLDVMATDTAKGARAQQAPEGTRVQHRMEARHVDEDGTN